MGEIVVRIIGHEHLDYGLENQTWCNMFPLVEVRVLEVAELDHLPLHLHLNKQVRCQEVGDLSLRMYGLKRNSVLI